MKAPSHAACCMGTAWQLGARRPRGVSAMRLQAYPGKPGSLAVQAHQPLASTNGMLHPWPVLEQFQQQCSPSLACLSNGPCQQLRVRGPLATPLEQEHVPMFAPHRPMPGQQSEMQGNMATAYYSGTASTVSCTPVASQLTMRCTLPLPAMVVTLTFEQWSRGPALNYHGRALPGSLHGVLHCCVQCTPLWRGTASEHRFSHIHHLPASSGSTPLQQLPARLPPPRAVERPARQPPHSQHERRPFPHHRVRLQADVPPQAALVAGPAGGGGLKGHAGGTPL